MVKVTTKISNLNGSLNVVLIKGKLIENKDIKNLILDTILQGIEQFKLSNEHYSTNFS